MIEILNAARCTSCDICVRICPTNVFESVAGGVPTIARHSDCQTCFQCEAYCPEDAIFVSPSRTPEPAGSPFLDEADLLDRDLLGLYRDRVGWRRAPRGSSSGAGESAVADAPTDAVAGATAQTVLSSDVVGLRVSLSVSLLALIVAEMSNAPRGIGFLMVSAQQYFQMDVLVVCVLIYAVWGLSVDLVVRLLERVLLPYKRLGRKP